MADKKKYYGHYVNNNKEGFGKFVWVDGKVFEGMWKKGKQDGVGVIKNKEMSMPNMHWRNVILREKG